MEPKFQVHMKIQKPVQEVFQAVYDPKYLSAYFTTGGASAPMDAGTTVMWSFGEFPGSYPVKILETQKDEKLVFQWENEESNDFTTVTFLFEALEDDATLVKVSEDGWQDNQASLAKSYDNCMGWSQMLCHLKAFLEYGINLRKGAY